MSSGHDSNGSGGGGGAVGSDEAAGPAGPALPGWRGPVAALWIVVVVVGFVAAIGGRALIHFLG